MQPNTVFALRMDIIGAGVYLAVRLVLFAERGKRCDAGTADCLGQASLLRPPDAAEGEHCRAWA